MALGFVFQRIISSMGWNQHVTYSRSRNSLRNGVRVGLSYTLLYKGVHVIQRMEAQWASLGCIEDDQPI